MLHNGRVGYFEWTTHYGFDMEKTLKLVGISVEGEIPVHDPGLNYRYVNGPLEPRIIEYFEIGK